MYNIASKIKVITLFITILIMGCGNTESNSNDFRISGTISGIPDGSIELAKAGDYLGITYDNVTSTKITNGNFEINGKIDDSEMFYLITKKNQIIPIYLEASDIKIEADITVIEKAKITGAILHEQLKLIENKIDLLKTGKEKKLTINTFIAKNQNSTISAYLILNHIYYDADYAELKKVYDLMSVDLSTHRYSQRIKNQLITLEAVQIGKQAPNFVSKDSLGNNIKLASYKGSYVLLDFWASWCGPCRKENPEMVKIYNEIKTAQNDFEIIGVAADFVDTRWKNAIKQDKLPWVNVSDIKGFKGQAYSQYGVTHLPYTILINKEGEIIEKGLTGDALRDKLRTIFK